MPNNRYSHITTKQLSRICHVSQGTVDRALHGRQGINRETKKRILDAAKKYGYMPNLPDPHPRGACSLLFGVILFDVNNDYFSRLIMDFEECCREIGYNAIIMFSHHDLTTEIGCLNQLVHLGVDGIVLCSVGMGEEYRDFLQSLPIPVVAVCNRIPGIPFVGIDDVSAMRDITAHAIARGYRDLIYFAPIMEKRGKENIDAQEQRYAGFCDATEGSSCRTHLVCRREALLPMLQKTTDVAVICPSDAYAIFAHHLIREQGMTQVGLSGFDDSDLMRKGNFPVDCVTYDRHMLVMRVREALLSPSGDSFTVPHVMTVRGTL